jgi:hypothetical protein
MTAEPRAVPSPRCSRAPWIRPTSVLIIALLHAPADRAQHNCIQTSKRFFQLSYSTGSRLLRFF